MTGGGERVAQGADDQPAHQGALAKPHLGLGRMNIDVDLGGRPVEKQCHDRVAIPRQHVLIGPAHRADEQSVAHRPAVDDEILIARQSTVQGRQASEPADRRRRRGEPQQDALLVAGHREGDAGIGHREPPHRIEREVTLGARRL
jgi:hypothetical protein